MPRRPLDLNEPRMKALLHHLEKPNPLWKLSRTHGQWVLRKITEAGINDILAGRSMFKANDVYAYTFMEVRAAKAHLAVLGRA